MDKPVHSKSPSATSKQNNTLQTAVLFEKSLPAFDENNPQVKGIILKFKRWPDNTEIKILLDKLKKEGLEKQSSQTERLKVWVFQWPKWHEEKKAKSLCKILYNPSFLQYCEPDYLVGPAVKESSSSNKKQETVNHKGTEYILLRSWSNNRSLSIVNTINFLERKNIPIVYVDNPEVPALKAAGKSYSPTVHAIPNTENNKALLKEFIQTKQIVSSKQSSHTRNAVETLDLDDTEQETDTEEETNNLKECDIVSSKTGLFEGKLSDYWAQEIIGADLIKEELEKSPPPNKHLSESFDSRTRNHGTKVRNLISHRGASAILPEMGDKAGITYTPTTSAMLTETARLLDKIDDTCSKSSESSESSENVQSPTQEKSTKQARSDQGSSSQKNPLIRSSSNGQQQETLTHNGTEYIMIRGWVNNRNLDIANLIGFLGRENISISHIDSPYVAGLKAAGESWSPTVHAIPNTQSNREKLESFEQQRGPTVYNRTLKVIWKTATNWNTAWKSTQQGATPPSYYDLTATYEVDQDKTRWLGKREYKYIFRPPVLDMRGASQVTASNETFNWLPSIVLASGNKLKVWGTKEVGNGALTINGVSVSLSLVSGTISDVPGSSKTHGRWEATLSNADFTKIQETTD